MSLRPAAPFHLHTDVLSVLRDITGKPFNEVWGSRRMPRLPVSARQV